MSTLPTVPSFAPNDSSITNLQSLSYAVSFLIDMDIRPAWHLYTGSTHAVTANTVTTETFPLIAYDNDTLNDGTGVTIVTPGYYVTESNLGFSTAGTTIHVMVWFQFTAGANNPNFSPGATNLFGGGGYPSASTSGEDLAICVSEIVPQPLYPGDTLRVQYNSDTATTRQVNNNVSYISGRFAPNFTGMMIRPV